MWERRSDRPGLPEGVVCRVISRNMDASKKIPVSAGILVFDFELFIAPSLPTPRLRCNSPPIACRLVLLSILSESFSILIKWWLAVLSNIISVDIYSK